VTPPKIGGGEQFLTFLREEVEPAIAHKLKIDPARRTLFGHSLGCSFTLHVLFTHTEEFDNYVCGSPSLYFNNAYILTEADKFMARLAQHSVHANLHLYVAEYDQKIPPSMNPEIAKKIGEQLTQARIVTGGRELANRLAPHSKEGLQTTFMELQGENHISEVPVIINRMLPVVLKPQGDD
jgi:predicted alpha/beta superfamily hydrolase